MPTTLRFVMWEPTDEVPPTGMAAYAEPDPSLTPLTSLSGGLRLHRIEDRGAWAKVAADNGWSAWVDGRLLVPLAAAAAPAPAAAPEQAPSTPAQPAAPQPAPAAFEAPAPAPALVPPAPAPQPPADQTVYQPIGAVEAAAPPVGLPLGAPAAPLGGGVPSSFAPPAGAAAASGTRSGLDPLAIAAAIVGLLLVVTYLLPWATGQGFSDHAFELAGDGRGALGDLGTRTDIGIVLLQLLYGAIVLGPVAALLFVARQPAARVVGILAGVVGLLVVAGRLLLDVPTDPGLGLWLSLLASIALVVLSLVAGSRSGSGSSAPDRSPSW
jgi:hypothetical protein